MLDCTHESATLTAHELLQIIGRVAWIDAHLGSRSRLLKHTTMASLGECAGVDREDRINVLITICKIKGSGNSTSLPVQVDAGAD